MKLIFMCIAVIVLFFFNVSEGMAAAPAKIKLKDYEFIDYESVKSLEKYANKKITFDMTFSEFEDLSLKKARNVGYYYTDVHLQYSKDWFKESFPREKVLIVIEGNFPIGIIGDAALGSFVKNLKSGDKITIYGKVRKKELKYITKRTFIYLEVDSIKKLAQEADEVNKGKEAPEVKQN